jgi:uncharacterized protein YjiS (DUF1127 family)
MTTTDCTQTHIRRPLALTLAAGVVAKTGELMRAFRNRREFYRLGQMSDLELADIGLRRGDLYAVSENPLKLDPTGRLGAIAEGRVREDFARLSN